MKKSKKIITVIFMLIGLLSSLAVSAFAGYKISTDNYSVVVPSDIRVTDTENFLYQNENDPKADTTKKWLKHNILGGVNEMYVYTPDFPFTNTTVSTNDGTVKAITYTIKTEEYTSYDDYYHFKMPYHEGVNCHQELRWSMDLDSEEPFSYDEIYGALRVGRGTPYKIMFTGEEIPTTKYKSMYLSFRVDFNTFCDTISCHLGVSGYNEELEAYERIITYHSDFNLSDFEGTANYFIARWAVKENVQFNTASDIKVTMYNPIVSSDMYINAGYNENREYILGMLQGLEAERAELIEEINVLAEDKLSLEGEISNLETEIESKELEIDNLEAELVLVNGENDTYKVDIKGLNHEVTELHRQLDELNAEYNSTCDLLFKRNEELENLTKHYNDLKATQAQPEIIEGFFDGIYNTINNILHTFFDLKVVGYSLGDVIGVLLGAAVVVFIIKLIL